MLRYRLYIKTVIENTTTNVGDISQTEEQFETLAAAETRFSQIITERAADALTIAYQLVIIDKEDNSTKKTSAYSRQFVGTPAPYTPPVE